MPKGLNAKPLKQVEEEKQQRREAIRAATQAKYSPKYEFQLHETRSNMAVVRVEVEAERTKDCIFEVKANPLPSYPKRGAEVKLNAAAVLREDAVFRKKQEKEAQMLQVAQ